MTPLDYYAINAFPAEAALTAQVRRVDSSSPRDDRHVVETFARYFLRELRYGSIQFEATEGAAESGDVPYTAYLFVHEAIYVGACCFRWREWLDMPAMWSLDWVWLHPFRLFRDASPKRLDLLSKLPL